MPSHRMPLWNVLVFPGGTEIGLEACRALRDCKEVNLFSAGLDVSSHAPYVFSRHYPLPRVYEPNWIDELNRLIANLSIDFIIPAHDDVTVALASEQGRIRATVVTSPLETCLIARSKTKTYRALGDVVPCPAVYHQHEITRFPIFCKPDRGQGSHAARLISSPAELVLVRGDEILLEPLPGEEFTVDCFSDREQGLLFVGGRKRIRVRNGISVASISVERSEFREFAHAIASRLTFHGAWFFQVKESCDGTLKLLEVAPRIAGAMAFHRVQGVNFPLLSLYEQARFPVSILANKGCGLQMDRALVNRYRHNLRFRVAYIDLDDTLLVRDAVSLTVVAFLYQCVNSGVKTVLVTKHLGREDLEALLSRHRLRQIFDEIVHLRPDEQKSQAITETDAIFIDDSFSERCAVHQATGLPTFDLSMLEMLIDYTGPAFRFAGSAASPR